jgi:hypothetical protein
MTGTLQVAALQLRNVGPQDASLYDDPEASLFSSAPSKRITPFSINTVPIIFNEPLDFGKTLTATAPLCGDMLSEVSVYFRLPVLRAPAGSTYACWTMSVGFALIEWVECSIGTRVFDRKTGLFMEIMDSLATPKSKAAGHDMMVGRFDSPAYLPPNAQNPTELYVKLPFWFCRDLASALPLFLMDKQRVSFRMKIRCFDELVLYDGPEPPDRPRLTDAFLLANYALVSQREKQCMRSQPYERVFEQWQAHVSQSIPAGVASAKIPLEFLNCVKEIVWVFVERASEENNDWFNYSLREAPFPGAELMRCASVLFDGKERFTKLPESHYRAQIPEGHHTVNGDRNIYVLSFAAKPELEQPTGTANLSRFDEIDLFAEMVRDCPACTAYALAVSYNTLVIEDGVARTRFLGGA